MSTLLERCHVEFMHHPSISTYFMLYVDFSNRILCSSKSIGCVCKVGICRNCIHIYFVKDYVCLVAITGFTDFLKKFIIQEEWILYSLGFFMLPVRVACTCCIGLFFMPTFNWHLSQGQWLLTNAHFLPLSHQGFVFC